MGRKKTNVCGIEGFDGPQWSRRYRHEWAVMVGHRIRMLRIGRGWSIDGLTDRVLKPEGGRYSRGYFSRVENGWASPPLYVYLRIAEALELTPGKLLGSGELERELTAGEAVLIEVVKRLGLTPEEAAVRLMCADAPPGLQPPRV